MAQKSEIITQSESSSVVANREELVLGELSIFGENLSSRTGLVSVLGQTISPTERYMKACNANPVQWCDNFLGKIRLECDMEEVKDIEEDIRQKTNAFVSALRCNNNSGLFCLIGHVEESLQSSSAVQLWWNRSEHNFGAFEMPVGLQRVLTIGSKGNWRFLDSLFPENFRQEAKNIPRSAFSFGFNQKCMMS